MKNLSVFKSITELMDIIDLKNKHKVTSLQIKILMYIMKVKKCNAGEICNYLKISKPTCSRILSKMGNKPPDSRGNIALGLIHSDCDYEKLNSKGCIDLRNKIITLTETGQLMADRILNMNFTGNND